MFKFTRHTNTWSCTSSTNTMCSDSEALAW